MSKLRENNQMSKLSKYLLSYKCKKSNEVKKNYLGNSLVNLKFFIIILRNNF